MLEICGLAVFAVVAGEAHSSAECAPAESLQKLFNGSFKVNDIRVFIPRS